MESLCRYGLEIREAWCDKIKAGSKSIELRGYSLPVNLLHEDLAILCTNGPEGRSLLGDIVEAGSRDISWIGTIRFSSVRRYDSEDQVKEDNSLHLVESKGSPYGWKEGTKELFGWVIERTEWFDEDRPIPAMTRVLRSIFQMKLQD